jgi:hypothetical protein
METKACACLLGDENHCDSCAELQAEYDAYCINMYESYLEFKEEGM